MWYEATAVPVDGSAPPVSLETAKRRLRIDFQDDDALLGEMLDEAVFHIERYCGIRLRRQVLTCSCTDFSDFARLDDGPISEIQSISYIDLDGNTQVLPSNFYRLRQNGLEAAIVPASGGYVFPRARFGELITVAMHAGYEVLPPDLRDAVLLRVVTRYRNPENAKVEGWSEMDSMLANFRRGA